MNSSNKKYLNVSQLAMKAADIANIPRGGNRYNRTVDSISCVEAARRYNVSKKSVERAITVKKHAAPELIEMVNLGKVPISTAADVSELPKSEQQEIVAKGKREILQAAKEIRRKREESQPWFKNPTRMRLGKVSEALVACVKKVKLGKGNYHNVFRNLDAQSKNLMKFNAQISKTNYNKRDVDFYKSDAWLAVRIDVLAKNWTVETGGSCVKCGQTRKHHKIILHIDHIIPRSIRPDLELDSNNLQVLCEDCNKGKSNRLSVDWRRNTG